jgi:hypothetical protein
MRTFFPPKVIGTGPEADLWRAIKEFVEQQLQVYDSPDLKWQQTTRGLQAKVLFPPPPNIPSQEFFYPFKIYTPTNIGDFVGETVPFVTSNSDVLSTCVIVNAQTATNLAAGPPQVSISDAWRFIAVRWGYVDARPIYSACNSGFPPEINTTLWGNYALGLVPQFVDNPDLQITPDGDTTDAEAIIVLGASVENGAFVGAALWVEVIPDTSDAASPTAIIRGSCSSFLEPNGFNPANNAQIPIGYIQGYAGSTLTFFNLVFDHMRNRFPPGHGNWPASAGNGTVMVPRGTAKYDQTTGAGVTVPTDLSTQVFYPGDIIPFWEYTDSGTEVLNIYVCTAAAPVFVTTYADTTIPDFSADSNWTTLFPTSLEPLP